MTSEISSYLEDFVIQGISDVMIPLSRTFEEYIGCTVSYAPSPRTIDSLLDYGTITSVNDKYVFVRFGATPNGIACRPEDLKLCE